MGSSYNQIAITVPGLFEETNTNSMTLQNRLISSAT